MNRIPNRRNNILFKSNRKSMIKMIAMLKIIYFKFSIPMTLHLFDGNRIDKFFLFNHSLSTPKLMLLIAFYFSFLSYWNMGSCTQKSYIFSLYLEEFSAYFFVFKFSTEISPIIIDFPHISSGKTGEIKIITINYTAFIDCTT